MVESRHGRDDALVEAARAGDRDALEDLLRRHLPLVRHLVRQALPDQAQVDDVVQDVMVRALRQLGTLQSPGSFKPWLTAIAVHQIGTHRARGDLAAARTVPLEEALNRPDAASEVEGPAVLRVALKGQRLQVRHAALWLAADDRTVFSLWWLELIGELSRAEVAAALGVGPAHAGVRIQRMREQLEASRGIVAALEARPGCAELDEVVADWDGVPSPFWRKRAGRHVRSCPVCAQAAGDLVPTDRLLATLALLPVPAALGSAALAEILASGAKTTKGASAALGLVGRAAHAALAHPLTTAVGAAVLAVGVTVPATGWATAPQPAPAVAVGPPPRPGPQATTSAGSLPAGPVSLESTAAPGRYVAVSGDQGVLDTAAARQRATFEVVPGLADPACVSLRGAGGRYLRHQSFRLRLDPDEGTVLFHRDATFCGQDGLSGAGVSLESYNFPTFFLRRVGDQLFVDQFDGSGAFRADSSFLVRPPLG
ncbi:sigma-70 family RNA polymerase sigma factor [Paractinoplanes brasiliensis]|uniref:RNA polymerase sigma factor n=1 Tax=Paractinoplanes brasiliensis TaxID=52695 RepID=A0A4R6JEC2_9ACTN|nr:sigma-70 family RNA polymerase sigma factor [Actinoplanes brasiliensis]TDO32905.1 RNA polymerase sigma factor (sigma-70 family) [Actinoplanes brasiliensis]GID28621.1 hypothetical protein Abr02nite_36040 [Actinoplanes brasiliensis]